MQKFDREGNPGELLAVKLTRGAAHAIAKRNAPATVHFVLADKSDCPNVEHSPYQASCK